MTTLPLGAQLRQLRLLADLTLEGLSERSGVSARTLSDIERGISSIPQRRTLQMIAAALDLTPADREDFLGAAKAQRLAQPASTRVTALSPHRVADFTGRDDEIAEVTAFLNDDTTSGAKVVVVSGPPGMGKTSIAVEALSRFNQDGDRIVFVDLDGFNAYPLAPVQVLRALLRQIPDIAEKVPANLDAASQMWAAATTEYAPIVVLDNAGSEAQVRTVLSCTTAGSVVVTSRRVLAGLEGPHRVWVGPLADTDSTRLLARLIPERQRIDTDLSELAMLCDRVPLALRIAGNRIASRPAWTAEDFIDRMAQAEDRLRLLVAGDLAVESAIDLSYSDLDDGLATLFRSISIIDGATFDARIAAATLDADVLETEAGLDQLTDLGLLDARGNVRYRMHDLTRLFASQRLLAVEGESGVRRRREALHRWFLTSLERAGAWFETDRRPDRPADEGLTFPDADTAGAWIKLEVAHWWPAMQSIAAAGDAGRIVDTADALHWFSDLWVEWGRWHEFFSLAARSAHDLGNSALEAEQLGYVAWAEIVERRDHDAAIDTGRRAADLARDAKGDKQLGWALFYVAWAASHKERLDESYAAASASLVAFERASELDGVSQALLVLSKVQSQRGQHARGLAEYGELLTRIRDHGERAHTVASRVAQASILDQMSSNLQALGRFEEALDAAQQSLDLAHDLDSVLRIAGALSRRASAYVGLGETAAARRDIAEALERIGTSGEDAYLNKLRGDLLTLDAGLSEAANSRPHGVK
ncbi:helix-turn-helix domain-containing protein [Frondihabitans australicus]|uniref:AAA ATPase-like protein n=1 Tax=Frondihabitans australicus TaxID=386892 RepID=A0A495IK65_9MICO|nr:helix-turn-helix domain-containing protein [Frondihabitans australicus]RKR76357.1 AAA ATPase-like protein [Frondihabitans australicus]